MDIFWLEARPWNYAVNAAVTVLACNTDLSAAIFVNGSGSEYLPVIDGGPIFSTNVFNGAFNGTVDSSRGQLDLVDGLGEIDVWGTYAWPGRPVSIYSGTLDTSNPAQPVIGARTLIFAGQAESYDPDAANLFLSNTKPVGVLASATYAGTGGLEGAYQMLGLRKSLSIGAHTNRTAVLTDSTKLLFRVNPAGTLNSIGLVREGGVPLDQPFIYHSSFADLTAASVPPTEIHVHVASGSFRLGFTPQGNITCDFRGQVAGQAYPTTIGALVTSLLALVGWDPTKIDTGSLASVSASAPGEVLFSDDSGTDIATALTSIMQGAGGYWDVDELGIFYVGLVQQQSYSDFSIGDEGAGDYDLLETDFLPTRAPFWRNRVAWGFNPEPISFSDTELGATPDQLALIAAAASTANSKTDAFFQATAPTTANDNDLWYNTSTKLWYRYDHTQSYPWVLTQDQGIGNALAAAAGAQATADGKITSYSSDTQPVSPAYGDLWVRPSESPRVVRRWTGAIWDPVSTFGATSDQITQINANQAQLYAISSDGILSAGAEKVTLRSLYDRTYAEYNSAYQVSVSFGGIYGSDITGSQRAAADTAWNTIAGFLAGLSPAWTDIGTNTPVNTYTLNQLFANSSVANQTLEAANDKVARDQAAIANANVAKIASDNVISAGQEKRDLVDDWNDVYATYHQLHDESVGFIGAYGSDLTLGSRANADAQINALSGYLSSLSPAWNDVNSDTNVNGGYLQSLFTNVTTYNEVLRTANNAIARQKALWSGTLDDGGRPENFATVGAPSVTNRVRFSLFEAGQTGWRTLYGSSGVSFSNVRSDAYLGIPYFGQAASCPPGGVASFGTDKPSFRYPCNPGEILSIGAGFQTYGDCSNQSGVIRFYDASGAEINETGSSRSGGHAFNDRIWWKAQVPAGAVACDLEFYATANGATTLDMALTKPMICVVPNAQSVEPPFSPGPSGHAGADVTALSQHGLTQPNTLNIAADYQGNVQSGQLPATVSIRHTVGPADVSAQSVYTISFQPSNGASISINNSSGDDNRGNVTISALSVGNVIATIASTYNGTTLYSTLPIVKNNASPPLTGGGGGGGGSGGGSSGASSSASTSSFSAPGYSASYVELARLSTVTIGSGGTANLDASLNFTTSGQGNYSVGDDPDQIGMTTQWQVSYDSGGSWTNVGDAVDSSSGASSYFSVSPPKGYRTIPGTNTNSQAGNWDNGTQLMFRLLGASDGGNINGVTGTITATPH